MTRLAGKRAVVTGGGRGLGSAIAIGMAAEGAHVLVVDRNREAADIPVVVHCTINEPPEPEPTYG